MLELITVTIGLLFPYLVLSLLGVLTTEFVARATNLRGRTLVEGIRTMLADPEGKGLARDVYSHHLVQSLFQRHRVPAYIPSSTFANVLVDILRPQKNSAWLASDAEGFAPVRQAINALNPYGYDGERTREGIMIWYSDVMEGVSGRYREKTQAIIAAFAVIVSVGLNVDTILLSDYLNRGSVLRQVFVASASELVKPASPTTVARVADDDARRLADTWYRLQPFGLPIGWVYDPSNGSTFHGTRTWPRDESLLTKIVGLALTVFAIIILTPMWFDTLNKVVGIRVSGRAPEEHVGPPRPVPVRPEPEDVA